jgi:hypothetical protein
MGRLILLVLLVLGELEDQHHLVGLEELREVYMEKCLVAVVQELKFVLVVVEMGPMGE